MSKGGLSIHRSFCRENVFEMQGKKYIFQMGIYCLVYANPFGGRHDQTDSV